MTLADARLRLEGQLEIIEAQRALLEETCASFASGGPRGVAAAFSSEVAPATTMALAAVWRAASREPEVREVLARYERLQDELAGLVRERARRLGAHSLRLDAAVALVERESPRFSRWLASPALKLALVVGPLLAAALASSGAPWPITVVMPLFLGMALARPLPMKVEVTQTWLWVNRARFELRRVRGLRYDFLGSLVAPWVLELEVAPLKVRHVRLPSAPPELFVALGCAKSETSFFAPRTPR